MDSSLDKRSILVIASLTNFSFPFMSSSIVVALPSISRELSIDAILLGWIVTAYLLASVIVVLPIGKLADIYGRKKVLTLGIFIYTLASILLVFSNSAMELISFRVLQSIGGAMSYTTGMAILSSTFSAGQRGRALGMLESAAYAGLSLGPFIGGWLTQHYGWRSVFFVGIILGLITIVLVFRGLKNEWVEAKREKFDSIGSIILGLALFAIVFGLSELPEVLGMLVMVVGMVGLIAFVIWELKAFNPILNINLFKKNKTFAFSSLSALISYSSAWPVSFLISLYLQYIKGFSPQNAGLILVTPPLIQVIFAPVAGRISDRIQPRIVTSASMALSFVGLTMFAFLNDSTTLVYIIVSLVILGFGVAFFVAPNTNTIMNSVDKKSYGVASAIVATMRQMGVIFSMGIIMMLFSIYIGRVQITPENYESFLQTVTIAFSISAVLCFGGIFVSWARGKIHHTPGTLKP
jgi:EmrB/QacA subfamily drug resistance transporter